MADVPATVFDVRVNKVVARLGVPEAMGEDWHQVHELIFLIAGQYNVSLPQTGLTWSAIPGDVLFYPAGTIHLVTAQHDGRTQILVLQWPRNLAHPLWRRPFRCHDHAGRVLAALEWLRDLSGEKSIRFEGPEDQCAMLLALIQGEIVRLAHNQPARITPVQQLMDYMESHMGSSVRVRDLARQVGLSPGEVSRRFTAETGRPPMRYLRELRLRKALHLITSTRKSLQTIANEVGIGSAFHLSALFSRAYGKSPQTLRRTAGNMAGPKSSIDH